MVKNNNCCGFNRVENTIFINNIDELSQKISQILPFSKVAIISFSKEYFVFGKELKNALLKKGIKVIDIILADNFSAQKDKFDDFLSLPEDLRGIIAFNNKLMPLVCSNYLKERTTFFIECGEGYGLKQNTYFFRDKDLLIEIPKNERLYIMLLKDKINLDNYIKCACIYVNALIDYLVKKNLLQEDVDIHFFNNAKSILIDILFALKYKQDSEENKIIENLLKISEMLADKGSYYSCSAVISSFLTCGEFFNIDQTFNASKLIIKKYEQAFNKGLNLSIINYNEVAKTLCFITGLNQKQILSTIESVVKKINMDNLSNIKLELKKLILLYNDFAKSINGKSTLSDKSYKQNLLLSISLSGFTPFGINGMTALQ